MSDGLNVGTVKGTVELEDRMSSAVDLLGTKIESLDSKFGGFGAHIAEQATSFFTAEAALDAVREAAHLAAETLQEITIQGSHAADIESTFEHLTESAGLLGDTLLSKTREGLRGTVTDMDIMTRVNQNLSVGLNLTGEQMDVLAKGAFALAKSAHEDVTTAMDKLSDAMVTGRTRGIALLTGRIDLAAAEDAYATKLGVTSDHLSEQGKQAAIQEAILQKVEEKTARLGDQQIRLADKIQQVKVEFANFEEELGTAIATSPVIAAGFDGIRSAIESAFGDNQAESVKKIAHVVDDVAISVLSFAENVVDAVGIIGVEWNAGIVVLENVKAGWAAIFYVVEEGVALIWEGVDKITFGMLHISDAIDGLKTRAEGWYNTMATSAKSIQEHKQAEDDWAVSTGKVKDTIEGVRQKMIEAQKVEGEFTDVIRDNKKAHEGAGEASEKHAAGEAKLGMTIAMTKDEIKKYNEAWSNLNSIGETWEDTLRTIDPQMVRTIQYYLDAGASVENLAAAFPNLTKAQIESVKALEAQSKVEAAAADELTKLYLDYYKKKSELYGTDTEKAIAAADHDYEIKVDGLQKKGSKDVEYYNMLWDLRDKDIALERDARLLSDTSSKASLDKKIADAKDYLTFMTENYGQYTDADRKAQEKVVENLKKTRDHWNEVGFAIGGVNDKVVILDHEWVTDGDIAAATINKTTVMVKTLSGEVISLMEAQRRQTTGGSFDVTSQNFSSAAAGMGWDVSAAAGLARQGYSMAEISEIFRNGNNGPLPPPHGPRIPGFRDGGVGDFGDGTLAVLHGPEAIVPLDKANGIGGTTIVFNVNGTGAQVAQEIKKILMRELKSVRQFGSA